MLIFYIIKNVHPRHLTVRNKSNFTIKISIFKTKLTICAYGWNASRLQTKTKSKPEILRIRYTQASIWKSFKIHLIQMQRSKRCRQCIYSAIPYILVISFNCSPLGYGSLKNTSTIIVEIKEHLVLLSFFDSVCIHFSYRFVFNISTRWVGMEWIWLCEWVGKRAHPKRLWYVVVVNWIETGDRVMQMQESMPLRNRKKIIKSNVFREWTIENGCNV